MTKKQERINKIIDDAAKALKAEGVKFFIGAVDRQPEAKDGGKAWAATDVNGDDMGYILELALPTREELVNLGIWLGRLITAKQCRTKSKSESSPG